MRQIKEASRSRRSSPLSHSGSVNQHLGRQGSERCSAGERCTGSFIQRRSHSRERSEEAAGIKSRIPLPVRILSDKDDLSSSGGDSHYLASPEPGTTGHVSSHARDHVHSSYVSSRYSDRYQPSSSYMNTYNPSHLYTDYTATQSSVYGGYRPTSAKDYNRYNYYSSVTQNEPDSYTLSGTGSSSPRWRRRSYDHDSDYLRYQRRTSGRPSTATLSDYPAPQPSTTSATSSSALTR